MFKKVRRERRTKKKRSFRKNCGDHSAAHLLQTIRGQLGDQRIGGGSRVCGTGQQGAEMIANGRLTTEVELKTTASGAEIYHSGIACIVSAQAPKSPRLHGRISKLLEGLGRHRRCLWKGQALS